VHELKAHLDGQLDAGPDDAMFRTPLGKAVRLSNFRKDVFEPAVRAAGLPAWVTPFTLRHTCASLLAQRGVPPSTAAAMLGHDPAVYLRTCAHLYPGDLRAAADALGAAIDDDQKPASEPVELRDARGFRRGAGVSGP
jgi:integrase